MPSERQFVYQIDVDLQRAQRQAQQLRQIFDQALSNVGSGGGASDFGRGLAAQQERVTRIAQEQSRRRIITAERESQERIEAARQATARIAEVERRQTAEFVEQQRRQTAAYQREQRQRAQASGATSRAATLRAVGGTIVGAAAGLGIGIGAAEIGRQGVELARLNTTVQRATFAFEQFSGSAGAAAANLAAVQQAGGGAIDRLTAMEIATQAMTLGLADGATELQRLTEVARGVATVSPVINDVSSAISEIGLASANLSFRRLDQLGLSASEVRDRMAELRAENQALSDEQAFLNAVLDIGEQKFGAIISSAEAQASGIEELTRAWREYRIALAESGIGQGVDSAAGLLADAVEQSGIRAGARQQDALVRQLERQRDAPGRGIAAALGQVSADDIQRLIDLYEQLNELQAQGFDVGPQLEALNELSAATINNTRWTGENISVLEELERFQRLAADGGIVLAESASEAAEEVQTLGERLQAAKSALDLATPAMDTHAASVATATLEYLKLSPAVAALIPNLQAVAILAGQISSQQAALQNLGGFSRTDVQYGLDPFGISGGRRSTSTPEDRIAALRRANEEARQRRILDVQTAQEAEKAFRAAAGGAQNAWEDAASAFEDEVKKIPGLFDASEVTAEDLRMAELGLYEEKPDEYLRRLRDEVQNGADYEGVDIRDAATRLGIDPNLPAEVILSLFEQAWNDSSLFAGGQNLDLVNVGAVQRSLDQQAAGAEGEQALLDYLAEQLGVAIPQAVAVATGGAVGTDGAAQPAITGSAIQEIQQLDVATLTVQTLTLSDAATGAIVPQTAQAGAELSLDGFTLGTGAEESAAAIGAQISTYVAEGFANVEERPDMALPFLEDLGDQFSVLIGAGADSRPALIGKSLSSMVAWGFAGVETRPDMATSFMDDLALQFAGGANAEGDSRSTLIGRSLSSLVAYGFANAETRPDMASAFMDDMALQFAGGVNDQGASRPTLIGRSLSSLVAYGFANVDERPDMATPFIASMVSQFASDEITAQLASVGRYMTSQVLRGYNEATSEADWSGPAAAVAAQALDYVIAAITPAGTGGAAGGGQ